MTPSNARARESSSLRVRDANFLSRRRIASSASRRRPTSRSREPSPRASAQTSPPVYPVAPRTASTGNDTVRPMPIKAKPKHYAVARRPLRASSRRGQASRRSRRRPGRRSTSLLAAVARCILTWFARKDRHRGRGRAAGTEATRGVTSATRTRRYAFVDIQVDSTSTATRRRKLASPARAGRARLLHRQLPEPAPAILMDRERKGDAMSLLTFLGRRSRCVGRWNSTAVRAAGWSAASGVSLSRSSTITDSVPGGSERRPGT